MTYHWGSAAAAPRAAGSTATAAGHDAGTRTTPAAPSTRGQGASFAPPAVVGTSLPPLASASASAAALAPPGWVEDQLDPGRADRSRPGSLAARQLVDELRVWRMLVRQSVGRHTSRQAGRLPAGVGAGVRGPGRGEKGRGGGAGRVGAGVLGAVGWGLGECLAKENGGCLPARDLPHPTLYRTAAEGCVCVWGGLWVWGVICSMAWPRPCHTPAAVRTGRPPPWLLAGLRTTTAIS